MLVGTTSLPAITARGFVFELVEGGRLEEDWTRLLELGEGSVGEMETRVIG